MKNNIPVYPKFTERKLMQHIILIYCIAGWLIRKSVSKIKNLYFSNFKAAFIKQFNKREKLKKILLELSVSIYCEKHY